MDAVLCCPALDGGHKTKRQADWLKYHIPQTAARDQFQMNIFSSTHHKTPILCCPALDDRHKTKRHADWLKYHIPQTVVRDQFQKLFHQLTAGRTTCTRHRVRQSDCLERNSGGKRLCRCTGCVGRAIILPALVEAGKPAVFSPGNGSITGGNVCSVVSCIQDLCVCVLSLIHI